MRIPPNLIEKEYGCDRAPIWKSLRYVIGIFAALLCFGNACRADDVVYPSDAGVINVKTAYGAKGDGVTDDTNAILSAIRQHVGATGFGILYFPSGTYLVSQQLPYLDSNGWWGAFLTLQGQNQANTIIKLIPSAPGFQDPAHPQAVIYTASNNGNDNPEDSANYNPDGSGNQGFRNHIMNLTVEIGAHNPGAIAIDYMANNNTRISDVTVTSDDSAGVYGINIQRGFPGPMYLKNLTISGFSTAIAIANSYGVWAEHLTLRGQGISGVDVLNGSAAIRDLQSTNTVPAIRIQNSQSVASVVESTLSGGNSSVSAIQVGSAATAFLRNITAQGYVSAINQEGQIVPGLSIAQWTTAGATTLFGNAAPTSLNLGVSETPTYNDPNFSNWTNVVSYGARPDTSPAPVVFFDSAPAIQAAIDSGYSTVYLPPGNYMISHAIHLRGAVQKLLGLSAYLIPLNAAFPSNQPAIMVDTNDSGTVFIDGVGLDANYWVPGLGVNNPVLFPENNFINNSANTLILTNADYYGYSSTAVANGTTVFLESVYGISGMSFSQQTVFARNLDPENASLEPHLQVSGGNLWSLGFKIEGTESPAIVNQNGARTELIGMAAGVFSDVPASVPMIVNQESSLSVETFRTNPFPEPGGASDYDVLVQETMGGVGKSYFRSGSAATPKAPPYGLGSADSLLVDSEASPFVDVAPTAGYFAAVSSLYFNKVTTGCLAVPLSYCPDNFVTRAQMAIFIVRGILGGDPPVGSYSPIPYFADVGPNDFGFASVQVMYELGITTGCGADNYCPDDSITRAQVAIFLIRARYGSSTSFSFPSTPYFTDVDPSNFAFMWIQRLKMDNITSGCSPTQFCPDNAVIRGDMALFIMRALYNQFLPVAQPIVGNVSPTNMSNNTSATLTLSGVGTHFSQGATAMHEISGLTFGTVSVLSPTTLQVPVTASMPLSAPASIWVTTGNEDAIAPNGLRVQ